MRFDSDYTIKLATLAELHGDATKKYDSTYAIDLEILNIIQNRGIADIVIDDTSVSSNTTWTSNKINSEIQVLVNNISALQWTCIDDSER